MSTLNTSVKYHIDNLMPIIDDKTQVALYLVGNGIPEPTSKNEQAYKARLLCVRWWRRV